MHISYMFCFYVHTVHDLKCCCPLFCLRETPPVTIGFSIIPDSSVWIKRCGSGEPGEPMGETTSTSHDRAMIVYPRVTHFFYIFLYTPGETKPVLSH